MNTSRRIRCIAIDDEPPALDLLVSYIAKVPELELCYATHSPLDGFTALQRYPVDLLFIDINMPHLNGLDLLRSLAVRPKVILTTAFREYAAEAFDLDALDYLVKPYRFDRFLRAISKYQQFTGHPDVMDDKAEEVPAEPAHLYFNVNKELIKVYLSDIVYIESIKDYIRVVTDKKTFVTYQRISSAERKLSGTDLVRSHKSYIVNISKVTSKRGNKLFLGRTQLPIGRSYKNQVYELLRRKMELADATVPDAN